MLDGGGHRRAVACGLLALLLLSIVPPGFSSAGLLTEFAEGPTVTLTDAQPFATLALPNPSRAVNASVDVSTNSALEVVTISAPERAWWAEVPGCATAIRSLTPLQTNAFDAAALSAVSGLGFDKWSANGTGAKPAALLEFNLSRLPVAVVAPLLDASFLLAARTEGSLTSEFQNLAVAFFTEPPAGAAGWREVVWPPGALDQPGLSGGAPQPGVRMSEGAAYLDVLIAPRNESARYLEIDGISLTLRWPRALVNATVLVNETGEVIWSYLTPIGGRATFGWTNVFQSGSGAQVFLSNGSAVEGSTEPLFVPGGAAVNSAWVELAPVPFLDQRTGESGVAEYSVAALSTSVTPLPVSVAGVPVVAHPTEGTVTLFDLTAHGVVDASQETVSMAQSVGNLSTFEQAAAQTFTVGVAGTIEAVALNLPDATGHAVGPLVVEVRDVSVGAPGTTVLATGATNVSAARAGGWVNFSLTPVLSAAAGAQFAIVLLSPGAAANETWEWRGRNGLSVDPYPAGSAYLSDLADGTGVWVNQTNIDWAFRVLLSMPFNGSDAGSIAVAGAVGPGAEGDRDLNGRPDWQFKVPGPAVSLEPDFAGGAFWNATIVNGLAYSIALRWGASVDFEMFPRSVEIAVGNRSAFVALGELAGPVAVNASAEVASALASGDFASAYGTTYSLFSIRVRAQGPADVVVFSPSVVYDATVTASGFAPALNRALILAQTAALSVAADAPASVVLSNLSVLYSEPPVSPPLSQPPIVVVEDSVNVTLLDLYQWFYDDLDGINLTFSVLTLDPPVATAGIFTSAIDANLTLTLTAPEYGGPIVVMVEATDSSGLSTARAFVVEIILVDDPPRIAPIPDVVLLGTTGTLDLRPYLTDNDTALGALTVTVSSVFVTVAGANLSFDYREAPETLLTEDLTIWVDDGTTNVSAPLRVAVNNAGRPILTLPGPRTIIAGHNITISLDPIVTDDQDPDARLFWELLRVIGVGATPGDGSARLLPNRALEVAGSSPGDIEVGFSVRDTDGNLASGVMTFHVIPNQLPSLAQLDGTAWVLREGSELRINLSEYLVDADDDLANFTFAVSWDNGTHVTASVEGGVLVVRRMGPLAGHARVSIVATDPAGAFAGASVEVDVAGAPVSGSALSVWFLGLVAAIGIAAWLFASYRKGQARRPALSHFEREAAVVEKDEETKSAKLEGPAGLEATDEERMLEKLDEMEREAQAPRLELPPATILPVEGAAAASSVMLLYRDGRPISWVAAGGVSEAETEKAQELAAKLADRARAARPGERIEGETVDFGGKRILLEARSQLILAAIPEPGADEGALREKMRAAMDAVFDNNPGPLKRWDGSRGELKAVEDVLSSVLKG